MSNKICRSHSPAASSKTYLTPTASAEAEVFFILALDLSFRKSEWTCKNVYNLEVNAYFFMALFQISFLELIVGIQSLSYPFELDGYVLLIKIYHSNIWKMHHQQFLNFIISQHTSSWSFVYRLSLNDLSVWICYNRYFSTSTSSSWHIFCF